MLVFESKKSRNLVGRFERGQEVLEGFRTLAREHEIQAGWVLALGALEAVTLVEYDQEQKVYKPPMRFPMPCEILSLLGNLSYKDGEPFAHVHATVSYETEQGISVLGGHLVEGRVFACEFKVEIYDDLQLSRMQEPETGLALWMPQTAPRTLDARGPANSSWANVSRASNQNVVPTPQTIGALPRKDEKVFSQRDAQRNVAVANQHAMLEEPIPGKGDWIEHKQFGLCKVEGEDMEGGILIQLPNGSRKTLSLEYMKVLPARQENDKCIYPVAPRPRER